MIIQEYEKGRTFVGRLDYRSDILDSINEIINEKGVKLGCVSIIGAVTSTKTGYFDTAAKKYVYYEKAGKDRPFEIASCSGNVSLKDGKSFAHLHIVFSDKNGDCHGGHLMSGTTVYACEFVIQEFLGNDLVRTLDSETGLPLWN